jgi:hypothetical protein
VTRPVFDMPASPSGWHASPESLLRIIDPLGEAIAWFAPELGACCAGFAVRLPEATTSRAQLEWRDIVVASKRERSEVVTGNAEGGASRWHFVERDPASCTMEWIPDQNRYGERWRMTASLTDARLSLLLQVHNSGTEPLGTRYRLRLLLSSPPRITPPASGDMEKGQAVATPWDKTTKLEGPGRIQLAAYADFGHTSVWTEPIDGNTRCTIASHGSMEPLPVIPPGESRQILVVIGMDLAHDTAVPG